MRFTKTLVGLSAAVVLAVGCGTAGNVAASTPVGSSVAQTEDVPVLNDTNSAALALDALPVKGRAPKTGYSREQFGPSWKDVDGNGCDTRNDVLIRDLVERQMSGKCKVMSGVLYPDPYTGQKIIFTYGKSLIDIDHVVALGDVWVKGGQQLTLEQRTAVANDPLNLLAVDYSANRQKSDSDAASWLPANKGYRCAYVARQIAVKTKYHLWVTQPEKDAMGRVLDTCPNQVLPTADSAPFPVPTTSPAPTASPAPSSSTGSGNVTVYKNCTEAKAAGVTPIRRDTNPALYEANKKLDRDGDGVACSS